jgi:hypothetical protein
MKSIFGIGFGVAMILSFAMGAGAQGGETWAPTVTISNETYTLDCVGGFVVVGGNGTFSCSAEGLGRTKLILRCPRATPKPSYVEGEGGISVVITCAAA